MAASLSMSYGFYFAQPWWLLGCILVVPVVWLGRRSLGSLGRWRRLAAIVLRCVVIVLLAALLARPMLTRKHKRLTVVVVFDRSQSIPVNLQDAALDYLRKALASKDEQERVAMVDVAEFASISKLPSGDTKIAQRNISLRGLESRLADGVQMAMAIAPPDTAVRILLVSEGNQTAGDLKEAARLAAANKIPIDVLPIYYNYEQEVVFRRLAAPTRARSGETVQLRFILNSTESAKGRLLLNLNGKPVDLSPGSAELAVPVELEPGTNVKVVSVPLSSRGVHEFKGFFVPDDPNQDRITQNNQATAVTVVSGPGHVLVADGGDGSAKALVEALAGADIDVRYITAAEFPDNLVRLMDADAVVLVNTDVSNFTFEQQQMLVRYVQDLGGGLVMTGGPKAFGAGGWIGSAVAEVLPVDLDPPQKKQLPKGALVLIMHACEMPQGNYWGKRVAQAAVDTLSRLDLAGILAYNWQGTGDWVYPLSEVGDKKGITAAIRNMVMGDMPSLHDHLLQAYNALRACDASQKHVIVISDGDPQPPSRQLLNDCKQAGITVTGVAIFPHSASDKQNLLWVARNTGGRYYDVTNPQQLPQIFIKEAQVVRRSLIVEQTFTPSVSFSLSEIISGLGVPLPQLDGYVLTGPKGGLSQTILATSEGDPVLASCQSGLGRCVAFTSSVDSRWAASWLGWGGFGRFWEQAVRWAAKPAQPSDCEILADVEGRSVTVNVEAVGSEGGFAQLANMEAQVISPDAEARRLELTQIGPGQYRGQFQAARPGSYVINLRYRKVGAEGTARVIQATATVPFASEFRDLSDNAPLLRQVSELTGGRILPADPNEAKLFDYAGVKFPQTQLPLTKKLMLLWLALFLADVAVRRIAVDVRAAWRRALAFVGSLRPQAKAEKTIDQLRLRREKLRRELAERSSRAVASRRYRGAERAAEEQLPVAKVEPKQEVRPEKPAEQKQVAAGKEAPASHIDQLLQAKRKAAEQRKGDAGKKT